MKGRTGQRWKELAIDLSSETDGTQRADIDIVRFEPTEVVALALGTGGIAIDGLPMKGKASLTQFPDGTKTITAALDVLPGTISFPDGAMPALMPIDSAHVELESGKDLSVLNVRKGEFRAGATHLTGTGSLREDNGVWRAESRGRRTAPRARRRSARGDRQPRGGSEDRPAQQRGRDRGLLDPRARRSPLTVTGLVQQRRRIAAAALLDQRNGFGSARPSGGLAALDFAGGAHHPAHGSSPPGASTRSRSISTCRPRTMRGLSGARACRTRRFRLRSMPRRCASCPGPACRRWSMPTVTGKATGRTVQLAIAEGDGRSRQRPAARAQRGQLRRCRDLDAARPGPHRIPHDRLDGRAGRAVRLSGAEGFHAGPDRSGRRFAGPATSRPC